MKKKIDKYVSIGNSIEIPVTIDGEKHVLKSVVEGIGADGKIVISAPLFKLNYFPLRSGDIIKLMLNNDSSGIVEFMGKIVKRIKIRNIFAIVIEAVTEPKLVQRREFFRMSLLKDITAKDFEGKEFTVTTKDLSAGGLSGIATDTGKYPTGSTLNITMEVEGELMSIDGEILYCELLMDSIRRYEFRIKFINITQVKRTKLMRYIFSEQRKLMRKGMVG